MISWEYIGRGAGGVVSGWGLQDREWRKFKNKLRVIEQVDDRQARGSVLLHQGGAMASERDGKLVPEDVVTRATANRERLLRNPQRRKLLWPKEEKKTDET